ncbi:hypothetical protein [Brachybacterium huguangmaarense]
MRSTRVWAVVLLVAALALPAFTFGIQPLVWTAAYALTNDTGASFEGVWAVVSLLVGVVQLALRGLVAVSAVMLFASAARLGRIGAVVVLASLMAGTLATSVIALAAQFASLLGAMGPDGSGMAVYTVGIPVLGVLMSIAVLIGAVIGLVGAFSGSSAPAGAAPAPTSPHPTAHAPAATGATAVGAGLVAGSVAAAVVAAGVAALAQAPFTGWYTVSQPPAALGLLILLAVVAQAVASLGALWASLRAVARGGRPLGAALVLVDLLALLLVPTTMSAVAILLGNVLPSHFPAVTTALVHLAVCAAVAVAGIVALRHGRTGASSGGTTGGTPGGTTGSASTATAGSPASGAPPRPGADASAPSAPLTPGASSPVIPPRS